MLVLGDFIVMRRTVTIQLGCVAMFCWCEFHLMQHWFYHRLAIVYLSILMFTITKGVKSQCLQWWNPPTVNENTELTFIGGKSLNWVSYKAGLCDSPKSTFHRQWFQGILLALLAPVCCPQDAFKLIRL